MKRILIYILAITALAASSCRTERKYDNTMFVSIAPIKQIVTEIVGDDFDVETLVPAGASPETFEPTPKQFIALNDARLIFSTGLLDFENNLLGKLQDKSKIIDLSKGIEPIAGCCSHHHHGKHCSHGIDPHIWCSPKELMIMAENAFEAISVALPDSVGKYTPRYDALCQKLLELDEEVAEMCRCSSNSYFIIYHPALTYFARNYGIEQVSVENEGKEASAKRLGEIITAARRDGIRHVFYQSQFPRSSVEIICDDIGADAVEIDPLAEDVMNEIKRITSLITE